MLQDACKNFLRPAEKRMLVAWWQETYRSASVAPCGTFGVARSSVCNKSFRPLQELLRARIREVTSVRVSYGYAGFTFCCVARAGG